MLLLSLNGAVLQTDRVVDSPPSPFQRHFPGSTRGGGQVCEPSGNSTQLSQQPELQSFPSPEETLCLRLQAGRPAPGFPFRRPFPRPSDRLPPLSGSVCGSTLLGLSRVWGCPHPVGLGGGGSEGKQRDAPDLLSAAVADLAPPGLGAALLALAAAAAVGGAAFETANAVPAGPGVSFGGGPGVGSGQWVFLEGAGSNFAVLCNSLQVRTLLAFCGHNAHGTEPVSSSGFVSKSFG